MAKQFVLDTNVLINDPKSLFKFGDNEIIIPLLVLEEIDGLKKRTDSTGQSARQVAREIDALRSVGTLHKGIKLPQGGKLKIVTDITTPNWVKGKVINDHFILQCCRDLQGEKRRQHKKLNDVLLVTEDINLRILADSLGVPVDRYRNSAIEDISFYNETRIVKIDDAAMNHLYGDRSLYHDEADGIGVNEYIQFSSHTGKSALAVCVAPNQFVLIGDEQYVYNIKGKNREQRFALDALTNPDIELVVLAGKAGTGKTLLALASGLEQVTESNKYDKLTITRPVISMGKELGFLPGSLREKLEPWMGPIYDNMSVLFSGAARSRGETPDGKEQVDSLINFGKISIEALQYIRGRSLPGQYVIIDEAQNLSSHEVKTIVTRAGKGTKLVFTGDPYQIDSPYLDQYNNGITFLIDKFKGQDCFAAVTLHKGERSRLAELGSKLL